MNNWINSLLKLTVPLSEADWKFKKMKRTEPPILVYWMGNLNTTPFVRHSLICSRLKGWNMGRSLSPNSFPSEQFSPETTHDLLAIYQKIDAWQYTSQLFRFQISNDDETAVAVAKWLATAMINCSSSSSDYLLDDHYQSFWQDIAGVKLEKLTPQSFQVWTQPRKSSESTHKPKKLD
ncbi:MAG: hypothetical protein AB4041_16840 [Microcystaceae cyanobacterium]